jgi:asparagine synthase (glutamine-hydrolysing)
MCGIAGFCDFNKQSSKDILTEMTDSLIHRGPDGFGYKFDVFDNYQIGLGHRRLSILDLSSNGAQPMTFDHLDIILNGEIYNYVEITNELLGYGYSFVSHSDTEVVLKAFHKWGVGAVHKFIGMFSFVIHDNKSEKLFIFRDRAGVKPLYYYYHHKLLLFASEIRAIVKHPHFNKKLNHESLSQYFTLGYIPSPLSIYEEVFTLLPGHFIELDLKSCNLQRIKYWDVLTYYNKPKLTLDEHSIKNEVTQLLLSACNYRMVSDVPVGVFLSGGYDSAVVTALIQSTQTSKLNTFTIGFDDPKYNEANYAKKIADYLGTNHHEYYCTPSDAKAIFPLLGKMFDEPFGDSSALPTYLVAKNAQKSVTVALSADGGDEVFGGYTKYDLVLKYHNQYNKSSNIKKIALSGGFDFLSKISTYSLFKNQYNLPTRINKLKSILTSRGIGETLKIVSSINTTQEVLKLLKYKSSLDLLKFDSVGKIVDSSSVLDIQMAIDYETYMVDDILVKVDRTTMAVSIEGREPLLDHRIIEYLAQVPDEFKIRNGVKKYLLKEITHDFIPKELMERPKKGFSFPVFEWLKEDLDEYIEIYLNKSYIEQQAIFNWDTVNQLIKNYKTGHQINAQKIWLLLTFQLWYSEWM